MRPEATRTLTESPGHIMSVGLLALLCSCSPTDEAGDVFSWGSRQQGLTARSETKKLTASDPEDGDKFGYSVSVSGDAAIVGAYLEDGAGLQRGAAYVFDRDFGGVDNWGEVKKLTASDAENDDFFGYSVSISGDTAIVGASSEWGAGLFRGAAYVFERNFGGDDNWGERKKLMASDAREQPTYMNAILAETTIGVRSGNTWRVTLRTEMNWDIPSPSPGVHPSWAPTRKAILARACEVRLTFSISSRTTGRFALFQLSA